MASEEHVAVVSPVDALRERLGEPAVAASLNALLDHADLLAMMVIALDGFLSRGDVIISTMADAVSELRDAATKGDTPLGVDVKSLVGRANALRSALEQAGRPQVLEFLEQLTGAIADVQRPAPRGRRGGVPALLRTLRDPDVLRGIDYFLQLAGAFGRRRAR